MCTLPYFRMQDHLKVVYVCKCITLNPLTTNTGPVSYDHEEGQGVWGWRQAHRHRWVAATTGDGGHTVKGQGHSV